MGATSTRTLALLALLQARSDWSGADLAERLGVSDRTIRNDVVRLRELGYPVHSVRGPGGRYRLGVGTKLPPLLLDDEEAVAVAVGLRAATGVAGIEETSARALAKLEQVLPDRLQRKLKALIKATTAGPANTTSNVDDPEVDAATLEAISLAIRDHERVRCDYRDEPTELEPYHLVAWQRRWYLVARDPRTEVWAPYRVDWMRVKTPGGRRFVPADFPGDLTEFVVREVARTGWAVHARIRVDAEPDEVLNRINPAVGTVEAHPDGGSVLVTGGDSMEVVAVWISMLGMPFQVDQPAELVEHVRELARRYAAAVPSSSAAANRPSGRRRPAPASR